MSRFAVSPFSLSTVSKEQTYLYCAGRLYDCNEGDYDDDVKDLIDDDVDDYDGEVDDDDFDVVDYGPE